MTARPLLTILSLALPMLAASPEVLRAAATTVTRGPYLQNAAPTAMTVRWRTDNPTRSRAWYGTAPGSLTQVVSNSSNTTEHELRLTGLAPGTLYYYAVGDPDGPLAGGDDSTFFRTLPLPGTPEPLRVWVVGDAGRASTGQRDVRAAYEQFTGGRHTDLWLLLGDNAYNSGLDFEYQESVFDMYRRMLRTSCVWSTRGNHDLLFSGSNNDYYEFFTLPTAAEAGGLPSGSEAYYSFDFANVHFVCLDSEETDRSPGGAMLSWLRQDLAATDQDWVICFWHHPPYSKGSHDSDKIGDSGGRMRDMRENVLPMLDSAGVDLVLTGHSHSYERSMLLDGHYDRSMTLEPSMILDAGDGREDGDGAYRKATPGKGPFEGAVYVVTGSAGAIGGGYLDHPVMKVSLNVLGSLALDIHRHRLDGSFITNTGAILDRFTLIKGAATAVGPTPAPAPGLALARTSANPGQGPARFAFTLGASGPARFDVLDLSGRRVARLLDGPLAAGRHEVGWDGRSEQGSPVAGGVYFAVLESGGERRALKLVIER